MEYRAERRNFVEENEYGGVLDMLNFKVVSTLPMDPNNRGPVNPVMFPPPPPPVPRPPTQLPRYSYCAHCDAVEICRLRSENQTLKNNWQRHFNHVNNQNAEIQKMDHIIQDEQKKNGRLQTDVTRLQKEVLKTLGNLDRANLKIAEQEAEIKKMSEMEKEAEKKLDAQQQRIKELENIIITEQGALERLALQKLVLEGKLNGIREFVKGVNKEFELGIEDLKREYDLSGHCLEEKIMDDETPNENNDEDENDMKDLQRNLSSLSTLVRDTIEDAQRSRLCKENYSKESLEISKITVKKTSNSSEGWSTVPHEKSHNMDADDKEDDGPPVLYPFTDNHEDNLAGFAEAAKDFIRSEKTALQSSQAKVNQRSCENQPVSKIGLKNNLKPYNREHFKYQCKLCKGRFAKLAGLKFHYHLIHKIPDGTNKDCVTCGITFPTKADLIRHRQQTHRKGMTKPITPIVSTHSVDLDLTTSYPQMDQQCVEQMTFWSFDTLEKLTSNSAGKSALDCRNEEQSMYSKDLIDSLD